MIIWVIKRRPKLNFFFFKLATFLDFEFAITNNFLSYQNGDAKLESICIFANSKTFVLPAIFLFFPI